MRGCPELTPHSGERQVCRRDGAPGPAVGGPLTRTASLPPRGPGAGLAARSRERQACRRAAWRGQAPDVENRPLIRPRASGAAPLRGIRRGNYTWAKSRSPQKWKVTPPFHVAGAVQQGWHPRLRGLGAPRPHQAGTRAPRLPYRSGMSSCRVRRYSTIRLICRCTSASASGLPSVSVQMLPQTGMLRGPWASVSRRPSI